MAVSKAVGLSKIPADRPGYWHQDISFLYKSPVSLLPLQLPIAMSITTTKGKVGAMLEMTILRAGSSKNMFRSFAVLYM